jgi:hypothetical protein
VAERRVRTYVFTLLKVTVTLIYQPSHYDGIQIKLYIVVDISNSNNMQTYPLMDLPKYRKDQIIIQGQ